MFINTLEDFAVVSDGFTYEYEPTTTPSDVVAKIRDGYTNELYGTKSFYSTSLAYINTEPYFRDKLTPTPMVGKSGVIYTVEGWTAVYVVIGTSTFSEAYSVAGNRVSMPAQSILSLFGQERYIGYGEQDILTLRVKGEDICRIKIKGFIGNEQTLISSTLIGEDYDELYHVRISALDFDPETEYIEISANYTGVETQVITYHLTRHLSDAVRIAWLNSIGGLEHYTFERLEGEQIDSSGRKVYHYKSAFETKENLEAMAEICSSNHLWRVDGEGYYPITLVSDSFNIIDNGAISIAELKFYEDV